MPVGTFVGSHRKDENFHPPLCSLRRQKASLLIDSARGVDKRRAGSAQHRLSRSLYCRHWATPMLLSVVIVQIVDTEGIAWNASRSNHPARIASWRALDAITRSDKERYVSLYAPDGVIHDPVGQTAFDPTGWVIAATCLRSTGCSCTARSTSSALSDNNIR